MEPNIEKPTKRSAGILLRWAIGLLVIAQIACELEGAISGIFEGFLKGMP